MCCITLVEQTKVEAARTMEFQLDLVIIMLDPGRHGGRWLMTLLDPRGDIHPEGFASLFFHLRDTELLVTAFPGCRTRFFLAITTCHATFPRVSVSLCFYFLLYSTLFQLIVVGTKRSSPEADPTPMHEKPMLANVITDDSLATA